MIELTNLIIGFFGGILAMIGTYLAVRQYKNSLPSISIVEHSGSGLLSPDEESKGYTWRFRIILQNQRSAEYAVKDVLWAPRSKKLSKKMAGNNNGWQSLLFDDVLKYSGHTREPFLLKPFEYRCLIGYWRNWWVGDPRSEGAEKYWRENPEESYLFKKALEDLHNNRIRFRIEFADGRNRIYHF